MAGKLALADINFDPGTTTAIVRAEYGNDFVLLLVTRRFVEDTWGLPFSQKAVRDKIADCVSELTTLTDKAHAAGKPRVILDDLSRTSWTNVPVLS